uniref:Dynein regulatory complex protein 12 n=1 Tax=Tetraselmis chuii TaxID=63592 RepID=A0A7S1T166_9CHLO|mmetsp:Transcript_38457/g.68953  ORF Transcript_38457/g.68953 Transcript_38457/m.68953 type:complete len:174 (+) Transcript_38457:320-841(+)
MAPKKKGAKKEVAAAKFVDKESLRRAEVEILTLQQLTEQRTADALDARRSERNWRDRVGAYGVAIEQQREDTLDITSDMLRQYKAMQDQLMKQVDNLEGQNRDLQGQLKSKEERVEQLEEELRDERRGREAEVKRLQGTIEEMQGEFAEMLKETLDKMYDKLDRAHTEYQLQF